MPRREERSAATSEPLIKNECGKGQGQHRGGKADTTLIIVQQRRIVHLTIALPHVVSFNHEIDCALPKHFSSYDLSELSHDYKRARANDVAPLYNYFQLIIQLTLE